MQNRNDSVWGLYSVRTFVIYVVLNRFIFLPYGGLLDAVPYRWLFYIL